MRSVGAQIPNRAIRGNHAVAVVHLVGRINPNVSHVHGRDVCLQKLDHVSVHINAGVRLDGQMAVDNGLAEARCASKVQHINL